MTFDETLLALCAKHDLTTISVSVTNAGRDGPYAYANVHWDNSEGKCGSGIGTDAVAAISKAIQDGITKRSATVFVPALELEAI